MQATLLFQETDQKISAVGAPHFVKRCSMTPGYLSLLGRRSLPLSLLAKINLKSTSIAARMSDSRYIPPMFSKNKVLASLQQVNICKEHLRHNDKQSFWDFAVNLLHGLLSHQGVSIVFVVASNKVLVFRL